MGYNQPVDVLNPVSTGFSLDEQGNIEDPTNTAAVMENTYQLGPSKQFPVSAVSDILKEETNNNLQEVKYEAQRCRELTLTLCE
ncbi:hypothetical protein ILYODFUR_028571, partial [Ilyodon furcidens]